jgi:hypothetical protein
MCSGVFRALPSPLPGYQYRGLSEGWPVSAPPLLLALLCVVRTSHWLTILSCIAKCIRKKLALRGRPERGWETAGSLGGWHWVLSWLRALVLAWL